MDYYILLVQAIRMLLRLVCPAFDGELAVVPVTRSGRILSPRQVEELRRYGGDLALCSRSDGRRGGTSFRSGLAGRLRLTALVRKGAGQLTRWLLTRAGRRCARSS